MSANAEPSARQPRHNPFVLRPRDPLIVRDARPFAATPGARAVTLPWPLPGTVVGALRGHIGNSQGWNWRDQARQAEARTIALIGYLRVARTTPDGVWTAYFPAPRDAVPYTDPDDDQQKLMCLRPFATNALPKEIGWAPTDPGGAFTPLAVTEDVKPDHDLDDWSFARVTEWLATPYSKVRPTDALKKLPTATRTHVKIDYAKGAADPGFLFSTEGLSFAPGVSSAWSEPETAILCRLDTGTITWTPTPTFVPLGGERRQSLLEPLTLPNELPDDPFTVPQALNDAVERARTNRLRLVLVTPAFFAAGWLPTLSGEIARVLQGAKVTLRGAAVERRVPVSGWDLARKAPKPLRYAVPAGSVYFLELDRAVTMTDLAALWMQPISDDEQDRRDGYGLVVPGIWDPAPAPANASPRRIEGS